MNIYPTVQNVCHIVVTFGDIVVTCWHCVVTCCDFVALVKQSDHRVATSLMSRRCHDKSQCQDMYTECHDKALRMIVHVLGFYQLTLKMS